MRKRHWTQKPENAAKVRAVNAAMMRAKKRQKKETYRTVAQREKVAKMRAALETLHAQKQIGAPRPVAPTRNGAPRPGKATPGCDCDQRGNPDRAAHASDCAWRTAQAATTGAAPKHDPALVTQLAVAGARLRLTQLEQERSALLIFLKDYDQ